MPPGIRHLVVTPENTLTAGRHFFPPLALPRALSAMIITLFEENTTNAMHSKALTALQAFASWWHGAVKRPFRGSLGMSNSLFNVYIY